MTEIRTFKEAQDAIQWFDERHKWKHQAGLASIRHTFFHLIAAFPSAEGVEAQQGILLEHAIRLTNHEFAALDVFLARAAHARLTEQATRTRRGNLSELLVLCNRDWLERRARPVWTQFARAVAPLAAVLESCEHIGDKQGNARLCGPFWEMEALLETIFRLCRASFLLSDVGFALLVDTKNPKRFTIEGPVEPHVTKLLEPLQGRLAFLETQIAERKIEL